MQAFKLATGMNTLADVLLLLLSGQKPYSLPMPDPPHHVVGIERLQFAISHALLGHYRSTLRDVKCREHRFPLQRCIVARIEK